jgi:hypothetical protein
MISTPGGKIVTNFIAKNTPLNLAGRIYKTDLIVLGGQGIDVILGMSWMRELNALFNTYARMVQLESLDHGVVTLRVIPQCDSFGLAHHHFKS